MVSKKALGKFKAIYKKRFGEDISDEDALKKAARLLTLIDKIYRVPHKGRAKDDESG